MPTGTAEVIVGAHRFRIRGVPMQRVAGVDAYGPVEGDRIARLVAETILGNDLVDDATVRFLASALPRTTSRELRERLGAQWWARPLWRIWVDEASKVLSARRSRQDGGTWVVDYTASSELRSAATA